MSTSHHTHARVNELNSDPAFCCHSVKTGDAFLFDLGNIDALSHKNLLRVRTVLVSHTHIDHFNGFDRLLRVNIPHFRSVDVVGPEGIINNVANKLKGYTWNLLEPEQINFQVFEVNREGRVKAAKITNSNDFTPTAMTIPEPLLPQTARPLPAAPATFVSNLSDGSRIEAVTLDHGIPSVAYICQAPILFKLRSDELTRLGLIPGPWISELQKAVTNGDLTGSIHVDGKDFSLRDLSAYLLESQAPRTLGYVTDCSFSEDNLTRLRLLMEGVETLLCETNFRDADFEKARQKKHLTTKQAALIAAWTQADDLETFHYSGVYGNDFEPTQVEALEFFEQFRKLDSEQLQTQISQELQRA